MPDTYQDPNQDYTPYQLTGDDLAELHEVAQQLQSADDPRADRVFNFIDAHSGGNPDPAAKGSVYRAPLKVTSWLDDLENTLWGSNAGDKSTLTSKDGASSEDAGTGIDSSTNALPSAAEAEHESATASIQPGKFQNDGQQDSLVDNKGENGDVEGNPSQKASAAGQDNSKPKYRTENIDVSEEDKANGNYVIVGFRHLIRANPLERMFYHTYVKVPVIDKDGKQDKDKDGNGKFEKWGVLGNDKSSENQQVRDDDRNDQEHPYEGKEVLVKVTPEQREALRQRMMYFNKQDPKTHEFVHPCPVCGSRYGLTDRNSNTFVYNMLFWNPGGKPGAIKAPKPPSELRTPAYYKNEPDEDWYPKK